MFKKVRPLMIASSIVLAGGGAITGIAISAVSCASSSTTPSDTTTLKNNDAYNLYNDFVYGTHGRWAGNYANFIPTSENDRSTTIGTHTFGQYGLSKTNLELAGITNINNPKSEIKLTHSFDNNKPLTDKDADGIGSHYAYEWLVNKIKGFGYNDLGGDYTVSKDVANYPSESTITIGEDGSIKITANEASELVDTAEGKKEAVVIKKDSETSTAPYFQKTGFITQGYLWNSRDRITKKQVANQYDQNIIVTIKALDDKGQPKFAPITSSTEADIKKAQRNAFWITAHYDSTGNEGIESTSWGATDNGSGVGAILDLVKYYSNPENAKTLSCDLNIAFVGGEEVGVTGSTALVEQFLNGSTNGDKINKAQIGGMLNLDTAAGGDNVYVHSPWTTLYQVDGKGNLAPSTETQPSTAALGTLVRDQLNAVSKMQADATNDKNAELQIHPFITPAPDADGYLQGQTGDWSDHAPFYKLGLSNVAYIEATNFQIDGNSGYDGYSQTSNKAVWIYKKEVKNTDGTWADVLDKDGKLVTKQGNPVESQLQGEPINVWGPGADDFKEFKEEDGKTYRWARHNSGAIWHWNFDRPQFMKNEFGDRMERQLTNLGATLRTFFTTMNITTFNEGLNSPKQPETKPEGTPQAPRTFNTNEGINPTTVTPKDTNFQQINEEELY